jgi:hypothetical protein
VKFFSILLTLYTLSLSLMPCADGYACSDEVAESAQAACTEHSDEEEEDFCSPFCVCACCAQSVWAPYLVYETKVIASPQQGFAYELPDFASQIQSIWQPPKLS